MKATALQSLRNRTRWIVFGAVTGLAIGSVTGRAVGPIYESRAPIAFDSAGATLTQASEISEAITAVLKLSDFEGTIERESGVTVRRLSVFPASSETVAIAVQASGDSVSVQDAAGNAVRRACLVLGEAAKVRTGADGDSLWDRIEREVAVRLPAPIRNTVRPWYEVTLQPLQPSPAAAITRRPALGGLLVGVGLAILGVLVETQWSRFRSLQRPKLKGPAIH